jgi:23S rRNA (adenine2503-C2)-methyltransferase
VHLLDLPPRALAERVGPGRAKTAYQHVRRGELPPKLFDLSFDLPAVVAEHVARDGTTKVLLALGDGAQIESVLIPERSRTTLCVSTQVGCVRGCSFCLTATMGLARNLEAHEIAAQLFLAVRAREIRNVVFMGMGEPLDNAKAVRAALEVMIDGFQIGPRHITVSTVAPTPKAVLGLKGWPARIAWSLHAADDELRARLIPTARHSVRELRDAFAEISRDRDALFVEVTLIGGVNDRPEDADAIAELFRGFPSEVRINLLPMNPIGTGDRASSRAAEVQARLRSAGFLCLLRRSRGSDERAACGQLATLRRTATPLPLV